MTGSLVLFNSFGRITCEDIKLYFVDILLAQPQRLVFSLVHQVLPLIHISVLTAANFYPNLASVGIIGLVLVESAMLTPQSAVEEDTEARWSRMLMLSSCRRDKWASRKDALQYLQNRRPWNRWDPRVLSLYIVCILQCDDPIE